MINLHESIGSKLRTLGYAIKLTTNCATGPGNFAVPILLKWARNQIMVLLSCYNSVLALFDCCGAILYEFLITGFMDPVYI